MISIHTPLAGSDLLGFFFHRFDAISIHTPLAGSDYQHPHPNRHTHDISIHALHEESDCSSARSAESVSSFQSTLSVRRATFLIHRNLLRKNVFQSTLSVRRATWPLSSGPVSTRFQSTLSVRRATPSTKNHNTRGDYFNPRSP